MRLLLVCGLVLLALYAVGCGGDGPTFGGPSGVNHGGQGLTGGWGEGGDATPPAPPSPPGGTWPSPGGGTIPPPPF